MKKRKVKVNFCKKELKNILALRYIDTKSIIKVLDEIISFTGKNIYDINSQKINKHIFIGHFLEFFAE